MLVQLAKGNSSPQTQTKNRAANSLLAADHHQTHGTGAKQEQNHAESQDLSNAETDARRGHSCHASGCTPAWKLKRPSALHKSSPSLSYALSGLFAHGHGLFAHGHSQHYLHVTGC